MKKTTQVRIYEQDYRVIKKQAQSRDTTFARIVHEALMALPSYGNN